jgi:hypothetical protein
MGIQPVEGSHTGTLGTQMRMIIRSVEQIGNTWTFGDHSKETANTITFLNDK